MHGTVRICITNTAKVWHGRGQRKMSLRQHIAEQPKPLTAKVRANPYIILRKLVPDC